MRETGVGGFQVSKYIRALVSLVHACANFISMQKFWLQLARRPPYWYQMRADEKSLNYEKSIIQVVRFSRVAVATCRQNLKIGGRGDATNLLPTPPRSTIITHDDKTETVRCRCVISITDTQPLLTNKRVTAVHLKKKERRRRRSSPTTTRDMLMTPSRQCYWEKLLSFLLPFFSGEA